MSFKSILKVAGKELNILHLDYDLEQETNASGAPSSVVRGGKIDVTFEATGDSFFFEWATNSFERKDGSIVFLRPDTEAKLSEVFFKESYLVKYNQNFDHSDSSPLTESITISARILSNGGGEIENEWAN